MTVAFVKNHTVASNKTSGTTLALTLDTAVAAGNLIVAHLVYDNAAAGASPIVASIGMAAGETNVWNHSWRISSGAATAGAFANGTIARIRTSVLWPAGTYTVTLNSAVTQKAGAFQEFSGVLDTSRSGGGQTYSTTTTAASATTISTNPVAGDLAIGFIFGANVATAQAGDTDTLDGAWSTPFGVGSTGGNVATNNFGIAQYKIVTGTSHQTLNNSAAMTAGNGALILVLQAAPEPAITQASYRIYDDGTETGATALAAQDTAANGDITAGDGIGQLRVRLQSTTAVAVNAWDDFQLQWERNGNGTWTNVGHSTGTEEVLVDSYDTAVVNFGAMTATATRHAQSFMTPAGERSLITRVQFRTIKTGVPPGNIVGNLYNHTGTFGSDGVGVTPALATSTPLPADASIASAGVESWFELVFPSQYEMTASTPYVVACGIDTATTSANCIRYEYGSLANPGPGNASSYNGTTWTAITSKRVFAVYAAKLIVPVVGNYNSPNLTDGAATTNRLGAGSGSFVAGKISETGLVTDLGWTANNYTELLFPLAIKKLDVVAGDVIRFRVLRNGATTGMTYTAVPTVNVIESTNPNPIIPIMATRIPS